MNIQSIIERYKNSNVRTRQVFNNIVAIFFRKGIGILISFAYVPLVLDYVNDVRYGIWLTITSFIAWLNIFDIGLGNGLRNKLAEAIAVNDNKLAKKYVSTAYTIIAVISILLLLIFFIANKFISWDKVYNVPAEYVEEISFIMIIVVSFFCMQFIVKIINTILTADQKPAMAGYLSTISSAITLAAIYVLSRFTEGSLIHLSVVVCLSNLIVPLVATFWFFNRSYKAFSPSFKDIDLSQSKDLFTLGINFFIIQITALIIYSSGNFIISHLFGPAEVTPYQIAYKYYYTSQMVFMIILTPLWSAFTQAYKNNEISWIKGTTKKLFMIWCVIVGFIIIQLLISKTVFHLWIGDRVHIPYDLQLYLVLYMIVLTWTTLFVTFLNGVGKIRLQLIFAIFEAIIYVPLAILLAKYLNMGLSGIIFSTTIPLIAASVWAPLQYFKIINGKAKGIWNK